MGMHLLLPFSRALRHPDGLHTGLISFTYFELSTSQSPNSDQDPVLRWDSLGVTLAVVFSFPCCVSPSAHPADLESKCTFISTTQVTFATTEEADQG